MMRAISKLVIKTWLALKLASTSYETINSALSYNNYDPIHMGIQYIIRASAKDISTIYRFAKHTNSNVDNRKGYKKAIKEVESRVKSTNNENIKWRGEIGLSYVNHTNNQNKKKINTVAGAFSGNKGAAGFNREIPNLNNQLVNQNASPVTIGSITYSSLPPAFYALKEHAEKLGLKFLGANSLENWRVGNCAEFSAALQLGVLDITSIQFTPSYEVRQSASGYGKRGERKLFCDICLATFGEELLYFF